jgi:hypothetical protein
LVELAIGPNGKNQQNTGELLCPKDGTEFASFAEGTSLKLVRLLQKW